MRNTMLIVVITVIATLAIDRVVPIALAQTNPSSTIISLMLPAASYEI